MTRNLLPLLLLPLLLNGCVTPQHGSQTAEVRAEQVLSVSLASLDAFLVFEAAHRAEIPAAVRDVAVRVRREAPKALESANRLRVAYKLNRSADNAAGLLTALSVVEAMVGEIRVWALPVSASAVGAKVSSVDLLTREAEASKIVTTSSWVALVPVFVDLAKFVFKAVNEVRTTLNQSQEWTEVQDAAFATKLTALKSLPHWL